MQEFRPKRVWSRIPARSRASANFDEAASERSPSRLNFSTRRRAQRQAPPAKSQRLWSRHWLTASQQQSPPQSSALAQEDPPLAELLPPLALDAATADDTVLVLAAVEAWLELDATEDWLELATTLLDIASPPPPPPPPAPVGTVSKSVVEPVAQLMTMPKPAANAPIPYSPEEDIGAEYPKRGVN